MEIERETLEQLWDKAIEKSEEFGGHCDCGYSAINSIKDELFKLFDKLEDDKLEEDLK